MYTDVFLVMLLLCVYVGYVPLEPFVFGAGASVPVGGAIGQGALASGATMTDSESDDPLDVSMLFGGLPTQVLKMRLLTPSGRKVYYTDGACSNNGGGNFTQSNSSRPNSSPSSGCGIYAGDGLTISSRNPSMVGFLCVSICLC